MIIKSALKSSELRAAADELRNYIDVFKEKIKTFERRLADKGITVAKSSVGSELGKYIVFQKYEDESSVQIVAAETSPLISSWLRRGQQIDAIVSPLLMEEFGSGKHAVIWEGVNGNTGILSDGTPVGRGTFPRQTHANESFWHYMDLSGNWHTVDGITPGRPMHNAVIEIITQIDNTAREVFGSGS